MENIYNGVESLTKVDCFCIFECCTLPAIMKPAAAAVWIFSHALNILNVFLVFWWRYKVRDVADRSEENSGIKKKKKNPPEKMHYRNCCNKENIKCLVSHFFWLWELFCRHFLFSLSLSSIGPVNWSGGHSQPLKLD